MRINEKKKRLIIVGGGFAGTHIALKLENLFDTLLIDNKDYFEFTPGILRTLVHPEHIKKIQVLHSHYLTFTKTIKGVVKKVHHKHIHVNKKRLHFDYLVIASGSSYNKIIKEPHSFLADRAKTLKEKYKDIVNSKHIIIIGGGIVGVELAAEIVTHFSDKKVTIVEYLERIMSRLPKKASNYAENFLKKRNVSIIYKEMIANQHKNYLKTKTGKKLSYDMVFNCAGIKPNSQFMLPYFKDKLDEKGFIKTNNFLQLEGHKNIFVAGDVTNIKEEKLAQNSLIHAELIIKNIKNLEKNKQIEEYNSKPRIMVISLGKYNGIVVYKNLVFTGLIPGILKSLVEWSEMRKYR